MRRKESRLIVALDVENITRAKRLVNQLQGQVEIFKIGPYLFTRYGPEVIEVVQRFNSKVFLDLKLHDIPNTVSNAVRQMVNLKVFMLTVHISGGIEMMKEAKEAAEDEAKRLKVRRPLILGVSLLSSLNSKDLVRINMPADVDRQVVHLSRLAKRCKLDGVVLSAREAPLVRRELDKDFIIASAGIRPRESSRNDQKRVMTPKQAIDSGCDYIIIGRPIIESNNPTKVVKDIIEEIS